MSVPLTGGRGIDLVFSRLSRDKIRPQASRARSRLRTRELQELRQLNHQHLVRIIGSYIDIHYIAYLWKLVAHGTLDEFLVEPSPRRSVIYGSLFGAMNYLHTHRVRHRDLTAPHILIDSVGEVYISYFGSSYNWTLKPSSRTNHPDVNISADYMAPEMPEEPGLLCGIRESPFSR
ncbi:hypothetical protein XA68_18299 [Ophiocordyceps unilateralis]|uniref:Protein kinase domain-containing protein n=1 Tax=Ophiocordyceps unilateralis TaxID=268505 RepID=A0A2A9P389_OPHUN|nr:hypothetical protein XA68_18299 [Ophiocordyceps unilateralis]